MSIPSGDSATLPAMPSDWQRALAVVAHPDDLEYGTSSAIAGWTDEGRDVAYLLVTHGEAGVDNMAPDEAGQLREAEQRASAALVGVDTVEFLDHPDGLIEYGIPLRRDIAAAIRRHRPDVVITGNHHETFPGGFLNMADHRVVGQAVIDASKALFDEISVRMRGQEMASLGTAVGIADVAALAEFFNPSACGNPNLVA